MQDFEKSNNNYTGVHLSNWETISCITIDAVGIIEDLYVVFMVGKLNIIILVNFSYKKLLIKRIIEENVVKILVNYTFKAIWRI